MNIAAEITQSFALDNGAYSFWKANKPVNWIDYYNFVNKWRFHPGFDFAVIPDVIDGSIAENDALIAAWPFPKHIGAPVWHTNEPLSRFWLLAMTWPRICIGSSGQYDVRRTNEFIAHARRAFSLVLNADRYPICKVHGLRMLNPAIFSVLPLASADSTNIARNIGIDQNWRGSYQPKSKEMRAMILAERIEHLNGAERLSL